jgi:CRISPR/Cas system-associated exonuclease Cas4 (RecB family)
VSKKSERELIDQVEHRLVERFADVPAGRIATAVDDAVSRFQHSVIRDFIPLLVERRVAGELSRLAAEQSDRSGELAFV